MLDYIYKNYKFKKILNKSGFNHNQIYRFNEYINIKIREHNTLNAINEFYLNLIKYDIDCEVDMKNMLIIIKTKK